MHVWTLLTTNTNAEAEIKSEEDLAAAVREHRDPSQSQTVRLNLSVADRMFNPIRRAASLALAASEAPCFNSDVLLIRMQAQLHEAVWIR